MMGEYDAGYENYIDSLIRETKKLQDENDKLREQVSSLVGRSFRTADKMSCLEDDNAKLRELAAEMFNACPMCVNCAHNHLTVGWYDRMRELGIEVTS